MSCYKNMSDRYAGILTERAKMHILTFFPLGHTDTTRIDLASGKQLLIDYADILNRSDAADKRIDLPKELRADLAVRDYYDVVAFTHLDNDHVAGSSDFFHWRHAACYQTKGRFKANELWVPAAAILDSDAKDCARVVREEAKDRLIKGEGIRVFSRPSYYKEQIRMGGKFIITMENPSRRTPEPLVIEITGKRGRVRRAVLSSVAAVASTPAPRAD